MRLSAFAVVAIRLCTGCHYSDDFVCGSPYGDNATVNVCDKNRREVCICATGGCARPDAACKATQLRYRESPFAPNHLGDTCVGRDEARSAISQFKRLACDDDAGAQNQADDAGSTADRKED